MKRLIADIHMHTLASGHAYGTIREMAAAAKEQQLQLIGISEHAPGIPGTVDPFYYGNLRVIPRVIDGVEILHGCEINVLNGGRLSLEQKYIDRLDYAIVGIHGLCYQNEGTDGNTTNLIECMKNPKVKLVSHPDDDHTPLDYPRLVQAALQYHVALEVNNSSLVKKDQRLNCYQNYRTMLALCQQYRVPIVVDSDAHDPSWVGRQDLACALLESVGFDEELVLNAETGRGEQVWTNRSNRASAARSAHAPAETSTSGWWVRCAAASPPLSSALWSSWCCPPWAPSRPVCGHGMSCRSRRQGAPS